MTKGTAIFFLGVLLLIVPSLGIPLWWKQVAYIIMGIILLGVGYSLRRAQYLATLDTDGDLRSSETFVETTEPLFEQTR
jgi:hypothetical protein